jgi:hypothetical protein
MRKPARLFVAMDFVRITKEEALKKELVDAYSFMLTEAGKKHVWMRQNACLSWLPESSTLKMS